MMNVLILSCGTGGGHNAAAHAVEEQMKKRGHRVAMMNPYDLCGEKVAHYVDSTYVSIAQASPRGFGAIYAIGNAYRRLPWRSPVYFANSRPAQALEAYLKENPTDAVITTHLYPAEMLTNLKNHGVPLPKTIFIATDYTCIPFTEECSLDAYVIPSPLLCEEFAARGLPTEKIYPFGIPVRSAFSEKIEKSEAKKQMNLEEGKRYLLVSGGSIGAGNLEKTIELLTALTSGSNFRIIAICGSNVSVYRHLERRFGDGVQLLRSTPDMEWYLKACDLYFTKPGGLSTTEAAVAEVSLALLPPIPGCESHNFNFFVQNGMAVSAQLYSQEMKNALALAEDTALQSRMHDAQRKYIAKNSALRICELAETIS